MRKAVLILALFLASSEAQAQTLLFFAPSGQLPLSGNPDAARAGVQALRLQEIIAKARSVYLPRGGFPATGTTAALQRDGVLMQSDHIEAEISGRNLRLHIQLSDATCNAVAASVASDHAIMVGRQEGQACEGSGILSLDIKP